MAGNKFNKTVIIIAGPTAVGKTAVAISLAKHFGTEIISADSRQCFKELNIGVARPSPEQLNDVPHHFIASHFINSTVNASIFEKYSLEKLEQIHQQHDITVMVGGTGLYIRAFTDGLDDIPFIDSGIRERLNEQYLKNGLSWLQQQVKEKDPLFFSTGEIQNPQRLMRALEIVEGTGMSIFSFRKGKNEKRDFNIIKLALEIPKENLHQNIDHRTEEMVKNGLVAEVKSLEPYRNLNALKTVGYTEIFNYLDKEVSLLQAIEKIKINTRQYAKRQLTWFKKDSEFNWFSPMDINGMIKYIVNKQFKKDC